MDKALHPTDDRAVVNGAGQAVSAVPASVPSALDLTGITDGGVWMVATVLSIQEAGVVNHAMHARWQHRSPLPCPLEANDAGWGDLWAAGWLALERFRAGQGIEAGTGETEGLDAKRESPVGNADAPNTPEGGIHDR